VGIHHDSSRELTKVASNDGVQSGKCYIGSQNRVCGCDIRYDHYTIRHGPLGQGQTGRFTKLTISWYMHLVLVCTRVNCVNNVSGKRSSLLVEKCLSK